MKEEQKWETWLVAAGEKAYLWDDFKQNNMIKIGWNELGDLSAVPDKDELQKLIIKTYPEYKPAGYKNLTTMFWFFAHEMKVGDVVFVKKGISKIIARGIVKSEYKYGDYGKYHHAREVEWTHFGTWKSPFRLGQLSFYAIPEDQHQQLEELVTSNVTPPPAKKTEKPWDIPLALNTIFYGPPGTGKTHALLQDYARKYFTTTVSPSDEDIANLVKNLSWWEVAAMVLLDLRKPTLVQDILAHALMKAHTTQKTSKTPINTLWQQLLSHTQDDCPNVNVKNRVNPKIFYKNEDSSWTLDSNLLKQGRPDLVEKLESLKGEVKHYQFITFHQSYSYESFVEGLCPRTDEKTKQIQYLVEPGEFKTFCDAARKDPEHPYAMFIDEINRGNVSGIFGELISLIEENKREGKEEEIEVTLPYSRESFSVPANLYIIGSMNTADRSIDALDSALRRRFSFKEMPPQPELLSEEQWKPRYLDIDLTQLLVRLNERVEYLLDRDHRIGHSYFMKIKGANKEEELKRLRFVFKDQIIPLLEDYFYGNLDKVAMVLGPKFIEKGEKLTSNCLLEKDDTTEYPNKTIRQVADIEKLTEEDFRELYSKSK